MLCQDGKFYSRQEKSGLLRLELFLLSSIMYSLCLLLLIRCNTEQAGRPKCPVDPYFIMPDKVKCNDFQILKLQESPDSVPHGEMPRHMKLFVDRFLVDKVVPGNRVTVLGIYSIMKSSAQQGTYIFTAIS